jgi:hypothetical protein
MATKKTKKANAQPEKTDAKAKKADKTQPAADAKPKKVSAIAAAVKILGETREPMTCPQLIQAMQQKGYWTSPAGKTPAATLYASFLREIKTKGDKARFRKTDRGRFSLA